MNWYENMNRSRKGKAAIVMSCVKKIFITALLIGLNVVWYTEILVNVFLETTTINCQPSPVQVICHISNEPYLGGTDLKIPKTQLTGIEYIYRSMTLNRVQGIVLMTVDRRKIPLHRNPGGKIIIQLAEHKDRIAKFIANSQAQTLNIKTSQRNIPLQIHVITGGIVLFSCLYLKKLWTTFR